MSEQKLSIEQWMGAPDELPYRIQHFSYCDQDGKELPVIMSEESVELLQRGRRTGVDPKTQEGQGYVIWVFESTDDRSVDGKPVIRMEVVPADPVDANQPGTDREAKSFEEFVKARVSSGQAGIGIVHRLGLKIIYEREMKRARAAGLSDDKIYKPKKGIMLSFWWGGDQKGRVAARSGQFHAPDFPPAGLDHSDPKETIVRELEFCYANYFRDGFKPWTLIDDARINEEKLLIFNLSRALPYALSDWESTAFLKVAFPPPLAPPIVEKNFRDELYSTFCREWFSLTEDKKNQRFLHTLEVALKAFGGGETRSPMGKEEERRNRGLITWIIRHKLDGVLQMEDDLVYESLLYWALDLVPQKELHPRVSELMRTLMIQDWIKPDALLKCLLQATWTEKIVEMVGSPLIAPLIKQDSKTWKPLAEDEKGPLSFEYCLESYLGSCSESEARKKGERYYLSLLKRKGDISAIERFEKWVLSKGIFPSSRFIDSYPMLFSKEPHLARLKALLREDVPKCVWLADAKPDVRLKNLDLEKDPLVLVQHFVELTPPDIVFDHFIQFQSFFVDELSVDDDFAFLVKRLSEIFSKRLAAALRDGNEDVCRFCIALHKEKPKQFPIKWSEYGVSELYVAAFLKDNRWVSKLLQHGADPVVLLNLVCQKRDDGTLSGDWLSSWMGRIPEPLSGDSLAIAIQKKDEKALQAAFEGYSKSVESGSVKLNYPLIALLSNRVVFSPTSISAPAGHAVFLPPPDQQVAEQGEEPVSKSEVKVSAP